MVHLLQSLWNHFAVWAFLVLLKCMKKGVNWGKRSKQISAFEDVSNMCISQVNSWDDWIGCWELVLYWSLSLCIRKNKNGKSVSRVCRLRCADAAAVLMVKMWWTLVPWRDNHWDWQKGELLEHNSFWSLLSTGAHWQLCSWAFANPV